MSSARLGFGWADSPPRQSVRQTTTAVLPTMGWRAIVGEVRFVTGQNCVSDRRLAIRSLLTGLPSLPLLPISFSACFVTHFDDSGLPGTSIAGERAANEQGMDGGLILNESHCAPPRFKWKNALVLCPLSAPTRNANESDLTLIGRKDALSLQIFD